MTQAPLRRSRRLLSVLPAGALLASVARADLGTNVGHQALDAGGGGPTLWTPAGPPLVGGPFNVQVTGGEGGAPGLLLYSAVEIDLFVPDLGATLFTGVPLQILGFVLDAEGSSPLLFDMPEVDAVHCGGTVIMQAFTADPLQPIGIATSNGLRLTVGFPLEPLFAAPGFAAVEVRDLATADVNGDGAPDIVVASQEDHVALHLGNGFGGFALAGTSAVTGWADAVEVADYDADGHLDLAVATQESPNSTLSILFGDGTGAFSKPVEYTMPCCATAIARADLDSDGDDDLVVGGSFQPMAVLLNQGDGSFVASFPPSLAQESDDLAAGDFDDDGTPDLAWTHSSHFDGLFVALGAGDGTFESTDHYPHLNFLSGVVSVDLDEDGALDLATMGRVSGDVCVWFGAGDGTFGSPDCTPVAHIVSDPAVVDADGDGHDDLVVLSFPESSLQPDEMAVLFGAGDGSLSAPARYLVGDLPSTLAVDDFDGDGLVDVAVGEYVEDSVSLRFGAGAGTFHEGVPGPDLLGSVRAAVLFDVDGDGNEDAVAATSPSFLQFVRGDGDGSFTVQTVTSLSDSGDEMVTGDWNGDGHGDLALAQGDTNSVSLFAGKGTGSFDVPGWVANGINNAATPPVVEDFDGDGWLDVALAPATATNVAVILGGPGGFGAPSHYGVGTFPTDLTAAHVDGDAVLDLLVISHQGGTLRVLLGNGDGTFAPSLVSAVLPDPVALVAADFDDDGFDDVAVANENDLSVTILLGQGDGTFTTAPSPGVFELPQHVAVGDFDGDDDVDLAIGLGNTVALRLGQGDGTFAPVPFLDPGAQQVVSVAVVDHDEDGLDDLVVGTSIPTKVLVYDSVGGGSFSLAQEADVHAPQLLAEDVDGDSEVDLLAVRGQWFVTILFGSPGAFGPPTLAPTDIATHFLGAGDFDQDGNEDLFLLSGDGAASLAYGDGTGSFQTEGIVPVQDEPIGLTTADFDEDGDPDLATGNRGSGDASILLGGPGAAFVHTGSHAIGNKVSAVAAADLDGDGHADLAATRTDPAPFFVPSLGAGDGTFTLLGSELVGTLPVSVVLTDVDRDGVLDALVGHESTDAGVLLGVGDGTFGAMTPVAGTGGGAAVAADFDTDGALDVLVPSHNPHRAVLARGVGDGSFGPVEYYYTRRNPTHVLTGDFDRDGRPDALVLNELTEEETVLFNQLGK